MIWNCPGKMAVLVPIKPGLTQSACGRSGTAATSERNKQSDNAAIMMFKMIASALFHWIEARIDGSRAGLGMNEVRWNPWIPDGSIHSMHGSLHQSKVIVISYPLSLCPNRPRPTTPHCLSKGRQDPIALEPIAIDVEYTHVERADGSQVSLAAWVCVLPSEPAAPSKPLLKTYFRHPSLESQDFVRSCGGVRLGNLSNAPSLATIREKGKGDGR